MKKFYKMKLIPTEGGLSVWANTYVSIHETPCYHYCIPDWNKGLLGVVGDQKETLYEKAKARNIKVHKVHKTSSRFAFETKELAYENLLYLKKRQLIHLNRDIELLTKFLNFNEGAGYKDLDNSHGQLFVPDSDELVKEHYAFD